MFGWTTCFFLLPTRMGIQNDCWYTDRKTKCRGFRVAIIYPERYVKRSNIRAAGEMGVSLAAIQPAWIELNSSLRITVRAKENRFNCFWILTYIHSCERLGLKKAAETRNKSSALEVSWSKRLGPYRFEVRAPWNTHEVLVMDRLQQIIVTNSLWHPWLNWREGWGKGEISTARFVSTKMCRQKYKHHLSTLRFFWIPIPNLLLMEEFSQGQTLMDGTKWPATYPWPLRGGAKAAQESGSRSVAEISFFCCPVLLPWSWDKKLENVGSKTFKKWCHASVNVLPSLVVQNINIWHILLRTLLQVLLVTLLSAVILDAAVVLPGWKPMVRASYFFQIRQNPTPKKASSKMV